MKKQCQTVPSGIGNGLTKEDVMENKKGWGKAAGTAACILAVAALILIAVFSSDIRGSKKALDTYFNAVQNGNFDKLDSVTPGGISAPVSSQEEKSAYMEKTFGFLKEDYGKGLVLSYQVRKSEILSQEENGPKENHLDLVVSISGKDAHETVKVPAVLIKDQGKWKIREIQLPSRETSEQQ